MTKKKTQDYGAGGQIVLFCMVAYVGAAVYFVQQASGFWEVVLALLRALVWPAYLVFHGLQALGA